MLVAAGRMRAPGEPRFVFRLIEPWVERRSPTSVPAEIALDHRFAGLYLTFVEAISVETVDVLYGHLRDEIAAAVLADVSGLELCVGCRPRGVPLRAPSAGADPSPRAGWAVLIWFVAVEPAGPWDTFVKRLDAEVEATGLGAVLWCSPFVGTVPGTDTYMDDLWLSSAPNPSSPSASCE
jgi:hypothetical protein